LSIWTQPSPSDCERFLELVAGGMDPYFAAREVADHLTGSRFRSEARRNPEFRARYAAARRAREEARVAGQQR
jgi:hypothetical protein